MIMDPVLFKSENGGQLWQQMDDHLCSFGCDNACRSLATVPGQPDTVYLGMDGHVLKSVDGGAHWQETGLKNIDAGFLDIAVDPLNTQHIVTFSRADTSVVYESFDCGKNWKTVPNPILAFRINEMGSAVFEQTFYIFFATETGIYSYKTPPDFISDPPDKIVPLLFSIDQNYPNPFNPSTAIGYRLSEASNVRLDIYNMLGQKVQTLVNERKNTGKYFVTFHADGLPSGIYYYTLSAGNGLSQTRKMLLLR